MSDPGIESSRAAMFPCVRNGENYCAVCAPASTDTAQELSAGCADAVRRPAERGPVTERTGDLHIVLSGTAHVPVFGNQPVPASPVDFEGRLFSQGNRIGVEITTPGAEARLEPVAPDGRGDYVGDLTMPIDFGALGNDQLAADNNVQDADVHLRFHLQGGNDLASATGATGQIETMHVEDVRLAMGGVRMSIDLEGPVTVTLDALPALEDVDPVGTPEWRACLQQIITRDCCVGPQVFADTVRIGTLPAGLSAPAACAAADEPEEEDPIVEPEPEPEPEPEHPQVGPGHEATQPTVLAAPPVVRDGTIEAGVENWYSIAIPAAGRFSFETTTGDRGDNSATDTKIDVVAVAGNGAGAVLGTDDDSSADGAGSRLELALPAGRVLVKVYGYSARTTGAYTLAIGAVGGGVIVEPPDEEPEEEPAEEDGQDAPVMEEPPDERVQPMTGYSVNGTRLFCDGNSADDVACWNNVNRQVIGGSGLRGKHLRSISWEMDAAARLSDTLEIEVYLIHGLGPRAGQVVEATRRRVDIMTALERGNCVERGETITCTATYGQPVQLPASGNVGDDWFILEFVGRDAGDIAPDGSLACGRYPHRVANNAYNDPTVNLGGYVQLHDWAGPRCEFSYSTVARKADMDLAASIGVE